MSQATSKSRCEQYFAGKPLSPERGESLSPWKTREKCESEADMMMFHCSPLDNAVESEITAANMSAWMQSIEQRVTAIESGRSEVVATFASSLACRDLSVVKPIPVTIESDGDGGFIASFMDAGISSGGDTIPDAFQCLQSIIAASFRTLAAMNDKDLGPKKQRERLVLLEFVCLRSQRRTQKISPKS